MCWILICVTLATPNGRLEDAKSHKKNLDIGASMKD